jgi:hypothetical protein
VAYSIICSLSFYLEAITDTGFGNQGTMADIRCAENAGIYFQGKHFARFAFITISQIGIRYRNSCLSTGASHGDFPRYAPYLGDRLPFVEFYEGERGINLQDLVSKPAFHPFIFPESK